MPTNSPSQWKTTRVRLAVEADLKFYISHRSTAKLKTNVFLLLSNISIIVTLTTILYIKKYEIFCNIGLVRLYNSFQQKVEDSLASNGIHYRLQLLYANGT